MPEIRLLTQAEASALPSDANWIGTLGTNSCRRLVKTRKQAEAWVRRVLPNWPGEWAVYEEFHYKTGESIGWAATAL